MPLTPFQKDFYNAFVLSVIICLSPIKALAYISPLIFLFYLIVKNNNFYVIKNIFFNILLFFIFMLIFTILYYKNFVLQNYIIAGVTYSSFLPILVVKSKDLANRFLFLKIQKFLTIVFAVELLIASIQAINAIIKFRHLGGSVGDTIEGTISPNLVSDASMANPMFIMNWTFISLFLLYYCISNKKNVEILILFSLPIFLLGSVIHLIITFIASFLIVYILSSKTIVIKREISLKRAFSLILILLYIYNVFINISLRDVLGTQHVIEKNIENKTMRTKIVKRVFNEVHEKYPSMLFIGFGPGQFSSRASLIGSGLYMSEIMKLPFLEPQINPIANQYFYDLYARELIKPKRSYSSTEQPSFSWLNMYTEFGALACLIIFIFIVNKIKSYLKIIKNQPYKKLLVRIQLISILFLVLSGFNDKYFEVPQAIFIGVLLIILNDAMIRYDIENTQISK